jgi:FkbM family methyltransferase
MKRSRVRGKLRRLFYPSFGRPLAVYRVEGLSLLLRAQSRIDRRIIESANWEAPQVARLAELTKQARRQIDGTAIFLDIGAYFGFYALMMRRARLFDRIIAFEPDAMNFAQLGAQLYLNDAAYEIEARRVAVSDRTGQARMPKSVIRKNRGTTGLGIVAAPDAMMPVDTIALDDEYDFRDALMVAKIDVEGHQASVLGGMRNIIARNKAILQIEIWENERESAFAVLEALGLKIVGNMYPDYFVTNIEGLATELEPAATEARVSETFDGAVPSNQ